MSEATLFDDDEALDARDEAIDRVEDNADADWMAAAERIIRDYRSGTEFTADNVWMALLAAGCETHERRAMGAVMRRMMTQGVIVNTKIYRASKRPECNGRPVPIWRRL